MLTRTRISQLAKPIKQLTIRFSSRVVQQSMGVDKEGPFQIRRHSCVQEWPSKRKITTNYMGALPVLKADMRISLTRKRRVDLQGNSNKRAMHMLLQWPITLTWQTLIIQVVLGRKSPSMQAVTRQIRTARNSLKILWKCLGGPLDSLEVISMVRLVTLQSSSKFWWITLVCSKPTVSDCWKMLPIMVSLNKRLTTRFFISRTAWTSRVK